MKTLFSLVVFIIVAVSAWWLVTNKTPRNDILQHTKKSPYLELFMDNFKITAINSLGKPDYTLTGKHLERYNNSADENISLPVFKFLQGNSQWLITAQHAIFNQKKNIITLNDSVVMRQQNIPDGIQISSQTMIIDTIKQTAYTHAPVHIKQGTAKMQSTGMIFYNRQKILELNNNVQGYYLNTNFSIH